MYRADLHKITEQLETYFCKRRYQSANIAGYLRNFPTSELFVNDEKVISFIAVRDDDCILTDMVLDSFLPLLGGLLTAGGQFTFAGTDITLADKIIQRYAARVLWRNPCYLYYCPTNVDEIAVPPGCKIDDIDIRYAGLIDENYTYRWEGSLEDIRECLLNRPASAVFVDGEPVSWALLHRDGTMGIMFTLPLYRRKGYADAVMANLVNKTIASRRLPFAHIVHGNTASVGLATKTGFKYSHDVAWFEFIAK